MAHNWDSNWPTSCTRCGAGKVMERAIAEGWVKPPPEEEGGPDVWKSSGHRELVSLCDDQCYADMGFDAVNRHKEAILALCEKIGWVPSVKQGPVHKVSRSEQEVALESAAKED